MNEFYLFTAIILQFVLVVVVMIKLGVARKKALQEKAVTMEQIALNSAPWPDYAKKPQNNLSNQFELPVLFIMAVLFNFYFNAATIGFVILSYIFVLSRWIHMLIHTGSNHVMTRAKAYMIGFITLCLIWGYLFFEVAKTVI